MLSKRSTETRRYAVDLSPKMLTDELITGTPTVVEMLSSDLTISNIDVNADERIIRGSVALKSRAVQFTVAGGTPGQTYTLRITVGTDATDAQTLIEEVQLRVY